MSVFISENRVEYALIVPGKGVVKKSNARVILENYRDSLDETERSLSRIIVIDPYTNNQLLNG